MWKAVCSCASCSQAFASPSRRPSDERHPTVTADGTVDNLAQAVDMILNQRHWVQGSGLRKLHTYCDLGWYRLVPGSIFIIALSVVSSEKGVLHWGNSGHTWKQYETKIPSKYCISCNCQTWETPTHLVLHIVSNKLEWNLHNYYPGLRVIVLGKLQSCTVHLSDCMIGVDKIPQVDMNVPVTSCWLTVRRDK